MRGGKIHAYESISILALYIVKIQQQPLKYSKIRRKRDKMVRVRKKWCGAQKNH
jgi:hypothetical protein